MVTAVTEAKEMVSGSSIPARRIAFLSKSSMSRTAGSSARIIGKKNKKNKAKKTHNYQIKHDGYFRSPLFSITYCLHQF